MTDNRGCEEANDVRAALNFYGGANVKKER